MGCPDLPTKADAMIEAGFVWCADCRTWVDGHGTETIDGHDYCRAHADARFAAEEARRAQ